MIRSLKRLNFYTSVILLSYNHLHIHIHNDNGNNDNNDNNVDNNNNNNNNNDNDTNNDGGLRRSCVSYPRYVFLSFRFLLY